MPEKRIISWNVNGIRAVMRKGLGEFVKDEDPDILCLQETKTDKKLDTGIDGYEQYWNFAGKKGYSGTALFTKMQPKDVTYGMKMEEHDNEGRIITAEFESFFLVTVYTPNSQRDLARLDYRMRWEDDFRRFLKELEKKKPVIVCGDMNVAHKEIDIARPGNNKTTKSKPGNAGFTDQERNKFSELLESGFIDTFRHFYPERKDAYTWWSYMFNARAKNVGWRLDYFCVSKSLKDRLRDSEILDDVIGSDHCPIILKIDV
ncbi:MAG: exodeoxyribonuclease III [Candidatus Woesearchaeota archaeon]